MDWVVIANIDEKKAEHSSRIFDDCIEIPVYDSNDDDFHDFWRKYMDYKKTPKQEEKAVYLGNVLISQPSHYFWLK